MRSRPLPVTVAAILLALFSVLNLFPVVPNGRDTGGCRLLGCCGGRCGPRWCHWFMEAEEMGPLAHHL